MKCLPAIVVLWLAASPAFSGAYLTGINFAQNADAINHPVLVENFLDTYATAAKPGPNGEYDIQLGSDGELLRGLKDIRS